MCKQSVARGYHTNTTMDVIINNVMPSDAMSVIYHSYMCINSSHTYFNILHHEDNILRKMQVCIMFVQTQ